MDPSKHPREATNNSFLGELLCPDNDRVIWLDLSSQIKLVHAFQRALLLQRGYNEAGTVDYPPRSISPQAQYLQDRAAKWFVQQQPTKRFAKRTNKGNPLALTM